MCFLPYVEDAQLPLFQGRYTHTRMLMATGHQISLWGGSLRGLLLLLSSSLLFFVALFAQSSVPRRTNDNAELLEKMRPCQRRPASHYLQLGSPCHPSPPRQTKNYSSHRASRREQAIR